MKDSPGGQWWQRCLKALIEAAGGGEEGARRVAERVVGVEFTGYHSVSFEPLPFTLPSQRWMFGLLTQKLEQGALFIGLRGQRLWTIAIPALGKSPRCKWASNVQRSSVSTKNVGEETFAAAIELLR